MRVALIVLMQFALMTSAAHAEPEPIFRPMPPADPPVVSVPVRCVTATITGYVRTDPAMNARTADGTSIYTDEPIVAASYDIPMGSTVEIEGVGTFRVADRGSGLSPTHVDVATWTRVEAMNLTSRRIVCVMESR